MTCEAGACLVRAQPREMLAALLGYGGYRVESVEGGEALESDFNLARTEDVGNFHRWMVEHIEDETATTCAVAYLGYDGALVNFVSDRPLQVAVVRRKRGGPEDRVLMPFAVGGPKFYVGLLEQLEVQGRHIKEVGYYFQQIFEKWAVVPKPEGQIEKALLDLRAAYPGVGSLLLSPTGYRAWDAEGAEVPSMQGILDAVNRIKGMNLVELPALFKFVKE